jgi:sulfotransferase
LLKEKQYHFISGLPRSGSTLLSSILSQNPKLYAGITSSIGALTDSIIYTEFHGTNRNVNETHIKKLVKSTFEIVYEDIDCDIIFDTNRGYTAQIDMLVDIFPNTKFICCVRSICDILNSFETLYRKKYYSPRSSVYGDRTGNIYGRCESLMEWGGVIGFSLNSLKQAIHSKHADHLYILEYDSLVSNTAEEINNIYNFLNLEPFEHNFDDIPQVPDGGCDIDANLPGLHDVRPTICKINNQMLIPNDILERYSNMEYWRFL